MKPSSHRSPGGVFLQLKSKAKFDSRRSPDRAYQQLMLRTEPGSRRSLGGVYLRLKLSAESDSRRSPDEVFLAAEVMDGASRGSTLPRTSTEGILCPTVTV